MKDLRQYLKLQYKEAVNVNGKPEIDKGNTYSYIVQIVKSNDKLIGNNDLSAYYNLAYGKHNPYESLNKSFMKIIKILWIYIIIVLYFIFHYIYKSLSDKSMSMFIHTICIFIIVTLMLITILPITFSL